MALSVCLTAEIGPGGVLVGVPVPVGQERAE